MKIIENGILRDMTPEEIEIDNRIKEDAKLFVTEVEKDYVEEFIDRIADANSFIDMVSIAKDIKLKRNRR